VKTLQFKLVVVVFLAQSCFVRIRQCFAEILFQEQVKKTPQLRMLKTKYSLV